SHVKGPPFAFGCGLRGLVVGVSGAFHRNRVSLRISGVSAFLEPPVGFLRDRGEPWPQVGARAGSGIKFAVAAYFFAEADVFPSVAERDVYQEVGEFLYRRCRYRIGG